MMLAMLFPALLGFAAILATIVMFATWLEYGSAWDAVDAEMRSGKRTRVRHVTVRVVSDRTASVRVMSAAVRSRHALRAAA